MALFSSGPNKSDARQGAVNAAKTLLANIRFMSVDDPVHSVAITSSVPNEGKTFVSMNLAGAIATSGKRVLLVECDMRRRSMANQLGVHARHGIYSVVSGRETLESAAVETRVRNLFFLDAEPHIPNPSDFLNSHRFAKFINMAEQQFDYVIFDTPPVGTFIDAAVVGSKVDAIFLVVRENFAKREEIQAAADQLRKADCNLAGAVMNYCVSHKTEYYYEYYYKRDHDDSRAPKLKMDTPPAVGAGQQAAASASHAPVQRPARPDRGANGA